MIGADWASQDRHTGPLLGKGSDGFHFLEQLRKHLLGLAELRRRLVLLDVSRRADHDRGQHSHCAIGQVLHAIEWACSNFTLMSSPFLLAKGAASSGSMPFGSHGKPPKSVEAIPTLPNSHGHCAETPCGRSHVAAPPGCLCPKANAMLVRSSPSYRERDIARDNQRQ